MRGVGIGLCDDRERPLGFVKRLVGMNQAFEHRHVGRRRNAAPPRHRPAGAGRGARHFAAEAIAAVFVVGSGGMPAMLPSRRAAALDEAQALPTPQCAP